MTLPEPSEIKRINVAVSPDMVKAIQHVMEREHVNLTEAVRRLLGYGDFVYRAIKDEGREVRLHGGDDDVKVLVLLNG